MFKNKKNTKKALALMSIIILILFTGCKKKKSTAELIKGMKLIPAGEFRMGLDSQPQLLPVMSDKLESKDASPMHVVYLDNYYIDIYEITVAKYAKFKTVLQKYIEGKEGYPVSGVSWYEAAKFCAWAGKRLPSEAEWEKAARGADSRYYPWGNEFVPDAASLGQKPLRVGSMPFDISPYGIYDMGGNVSEWTSSLYEPYADSTYKSDLYDRKFAVSRGGSFSKKVSHSYHEIFSQVTFRHASPANSGALDTGFRCAMN